MIAVCCFSVVNAAALEVSDVRKSLISTLTLLLFDTEAPFHLIESSGKEGWRGVVLSPPGTTLSPLITSYDPFSFDEQSSGKQNANNHFLDRIIKFQNGLGVRGEISLGQIWQDIVDRSLPSGPSANKQQLLRAEKVLFRQPDRVDAARGVQFLREPSSVFLKYQEYAALYDLVATDNDAWRIHPRLSQFTSAKQAQQQLSQEWLLYGYKKEVELALKNYKLASNTMAWVNWTDFSSKYAKGQIRSDDGRLIPRTFLFPPPSVWLDMNSWINVSSKDPAGGGEFRFQMARIEVVRPWMAVEGVTEKLISVDLDRPSNKGIVVSSGAEPTLEKAPEGTLPAYIEELIIVRNIVLVGDPNSDWIRSNQLAIYAYPQTVNLLGFVVRTLPKIP